MEGRGWTEMADSAKHSRFVWTLPTQSRTDLAHRNSNGLFVTLSEPICRKVILGCPFTITYLLLIGTEVIDLLYARVPKYHFDLPFLPCATYLLDPNYLNFSVLGQQQFNCSRKLLFLGQTRQPVLKIVLDAGGG